MKRRCGRCGSEVEDARWTSAQDHLVPIDLNLGTDLTRLDGSWPEGAQHTAACSDVYGHLPWHEARV